MSQKQSKKSKSALVQDFCNYLQFNKGLSDNTIKAYKSDILKFLQFLEGDEIPETLVEILRHFAIDFVPETEAACKAINEWLAENESLAPGSEAQRAVGLPGSFVIQGIELRTGCSAV